MYHYFNVRYPERAEHYAQIALVWSEHRADSARACTALQEGLQARAAPEGLLEKAWTDLQCQRAEGKAP